MTSIFKKSFDVYADNRQSIKFKEVVNNLKIMTYEELNNHRYHDGNISVEAQFHKKMH